DPRRASRSAIHSAAREWHRQRLSRPCVCRQMDIGLKPREATFVEAPQYSILNMSCLVLDGDMLVAKLPPHGDDFGEPFSGGGALNNACRHDRDVFCNQLRIE